MKRVAFAILAATCVLARPAQAQSIHLKTVATNLEAPLGFVQDPTQPNVQFIVLQTGHIRVLQDGVLLDQDFLNISGEVSQAGEGGLFGLAMAPDYGVSGRFFVNFLNHEGNTVIARFRRSDGDALVANVDSRFDFSWPGGLPYISQPYGEHNGGDLAFGSDGYLYIGLGDGGGANDPEHRAQDPATLLGKMLRLDVSVADDDPEGYDVPETNPFVGQDGILPEIWAFGLRNPWRYTFDDPARGGTGALLMADVGQDTIEELNYEPAGAGGRNYGWRNYEGSQENVTDLPLFSDPTFPIFEYDHAAGKTIIAGFVYRGSALDASFVGRAFFADFIFPRVWSLDLDIDSNGEATAGTLHEHTAEFGGGNAFGMITAFGVDAAGELYLVSYSKGTVYRIEPGPGEPESHPILHFDPVPAGPLAQPFQITGWAADLGALNGSGIDFVHLWAVPSEGPSLFLGQSGGGSRPDIAGQYGAQFANSGFSATVHDFPAGPALIVAYGHSDLTDQFVVVGSMWIDIPAALPMQMDLESPPPSSSAPGIVTLSGWAIDRSGLAGTGVDFLHVWAVDDQNIAQFVGWAEYGRPRADIAAQFGSRFLNSGWTITATDLHPGWWTFVVYAHSRVTQTFRDARTVAVYITNFVAGMRLTIDRPDQNEVVTSPNPGLVRGWSLDLGAKSGTSGIEVIHVWAVPANGDPGIFVGSAALGFSRPDVAADFGSQFENCGFELPFNLPPGTYNLVVYAFSTRTQRFDAAAVVTVVIEEPPPTNETISTSDPSLISSSP